MRVLLDECLPRPFKRDLIGHEAVTVPEMGWAGTKNGALLRLAEAEFDAFITVDQSLLYQQKIAGRSLGVIVLDAPDNQLDTLRRCTPEILAVLSALRPGAIMRVVVT